MGLEISWGECDPRLPKATQVYDLVRAAIISIALPPDAAIPEKSICEQLSISRTPVREAILQLAAENLVIVRPSGGTYVSQIAMQQVIEGYLTRDTLEKRLVRLAARNWDARQIDAFELSLFRQKQSARAKNIDDFFRLDNDFHKLIVEASGYPNLWRVIHVATGQLDRVRRLAFKLESNFQLGLEQHQKIFDAIAARDESAASQHFSEHIEMIFDDIERMKPTHPELIADASPDRLRLSEFRD